MLVKNGRRTKNVAEVPAIAIRIQMVFCHELANRVIPHKVIRIIEINFLNGDAVAGYRVAVIRNSLGNPVMTSNDFHIPDIVFVTEDYAIAFCRAVFFDQLSQVLNPFARAVDKGQSGGNDQIFVDAGIFNQWIKGQYSFIRIGAFRGAHANVLFVKAAFIKDAFRFVVDVGRSLVAIAVGRTINHAFVKVGLNLVGLIMVCRVGNEALWSQGTKRIIVTGSHG